MAFFVILTSYSKAWICQTKLNCEEICWGIRKCHQFYLKMLFWCYSDVIMTSVLPFLLHFAAKIVNSSIQIAWEYLFLTCLRWGTTNCWSFCKFNVIMTSLWRYYDAIFTIFSSKIIKSSIQIVWKWLIPLFNVFWVRKNEF